MGPTHSSADALSPENAARYQRRVDGATSLVFQDEAAWNRVLRPGTPNEFLSGWLALQCRLMAHARLGVLILREDARGKLVPAAQWPEHAALSPILAEAAGRAAENAKSVLCRGGSAGAANAVAQPIFVGDELRGVAAIEVTATSEADLTESVHQLQWGAVWIERWLAVRDKGSSANAALAMDILSECLRMPHFHAAALATVAQLADKLGCEQVAFGVVRGRRVRLCAISHCTHFSHRSALVGAIERAMEEAVEIGSTVILQGASSNDGPAIPAHETLAAREEVAGHAIITVPVKGEHGPDAAFTFQLPAGRSANTEISSLLAACAVPAGGVLTRYWLEQRPLWERMLRKARDVAALAVGPAHIPAKLACVALLAAIAFFAVFTITFRISGDARIEGQIQQSTVAPFAGYIAQASVRPGDRVKSGDLLAQLYDRDLRLEHHAWSSRREQFARELQRSLSEHKLAMANVYRAQMEEASAQIALIAQKIERTRIEAPFDAIVIEGDLTQTLGRAVQQGEVLYKLAPLDAYRIVIEVDERDIHFIANQQAGHLLLMAMPDKPLPFQVVKITPTTSSTKGRNAFRVEARLNEPFNALRPGMEGIAKVEAGSQLAIWIWTRRLVDWARLQVWAWWP
jgi:multidrug resistance efflux pump